MPYRHLRPTMTQFTYECGEQQFTVIAHDRDEAFHKAEQEAALRGLHDEELRLVDEQPYDPSGGDDPED